MKSKHLTDVEIDGINFRDAPDFADAFVSAAAWAESGKDLTDDELDELNDSDQRFRLIENYIY